jgi:xanthine dehydrogenase accessory factor
LDSQDLQVLAAVRRWAESGRRFALVTVARTWGSAPRPPGAWMALRDDGLVQGSVSGGCIEDDLIRRLASGGLAGTKPFRLDYGVTREEARRYGLPCGGTLELVVEPAPDPALLAELERRVAAGETARRTVNLESGAVILSAGAADAAVAWDGRRLSTPHGPRWRLLIVGAGQISRYLAQMAQALDYAVTVCDPRKQYHVEWDVEGAPWVPGFPDDAVLEMRPDPHTAIVALTHDPKLDDMALLEALKTPAFYVGALGSQANNARRRERLLQYFDLTEAQVASLRGPVGLPIGSRTPPEIAISVLAEMTAVKHGRGRVAASLEIPEAIPGAGCGTDKSARVCGAG